MSLESKMTPEQLENFRAVNRRMGLPEDTVTDHTPPAQLRSSAVGSGSPKVVFSGDPDESHFTPHLITVNSIADYNQMVGAPDDQDDSHVVYPKALPNTLKTKMAGATAALSEEDLNVIQNAKYAYLQGNSTKVKEFEPLINEHFFPKTVAYFASDNLTIDTPVQVSGPTPVVWNYNQISMEQDGSLTATTELSVTANQLVSDGDKIIEAIGGPQVNPTAQNGGAGQTGGAGSQGTSAVCGPDSSISGTPTVCVTAPGPGSAGTGGTNGGSGSPGIKGNAQLPLNVNITQAITGNLTIRGGGGTGQNGGNGGNGGDGGAGGAAGVNCDQCTASYAGTQGSGGNGGNGGNAGDGGDGAAINVTYSSLAGNLSAVYVGGQPGLAGQGGQAGAGGGGTTGANGANGSPGAQSTITANGSPF